MSASMSGATRAIRRPAVVAFTAQQDHGHRRERLHAQRRIGDRHVREGEIQLPQFNHGFQKLRLTPAAARKLTAAPSRADARPSR